MHKSELGNFVPPREEKLLTATELRRGQESGQNRPSPAQTCGGKKARSSKSPPARPSHRNQSVAPGEKGCPEALAYTTAACASKNQNHMWAQPRKASEVSSPGSPAGSTVRLPPPLTEDRRAVSPGSHSKKVRFRDRVPAA